jgi:short-subunit dehydrogenase
VVTGAANGLGAALAGALAERGSSLALVDRDSAGLQRVVTAIGAAHPRLNVTAHHADFSEIDDFRGLADEIRRDHPRIGLLVNNAGVALGGRVEEVSMADIDWIMTINFRSPVALVKQFLPDLRANPGSHIANISSLFGLIAPAGQASYSASKFAIRGFTLALQAELIPAGIGVTVVRPGGIATNIAKTARVGGAGSVNQAEVDAARNRIGAMLTMLRKLPPPRFWRPSNGGGSAWLSLAAPSSPIESFGSCPCASGASSTARWTAESMDRHHGKPKTKD